MQLSRHVLPKLVLKAHMKVGDDRHNLRHHFFYECSLQSYESLGSQRALKMKHNLTAFSFGERELSQSLTGTSDTVKSHSPSQAPTPSFFVLITHARAVFRPQTFLDDKGGCRDKRICLRLSPTDFKTERCEKSILHSKMRLHSSTCVWYISAFGDNRQGKQTV